MIFNIGPWWLFDILALAIIISTTAFGAKRGFFVSFYILLVELVAIVLMMFIPTIITNSINKTVVNFLASKGLASAFESMSDSIKDVLLNLFKTMGITSDLNFDSQGLGYEFFTVCVACVLYLILTILTFILVNLIGLFLFIAVKKRIRRLKIIGSADTMLGAVNGFAIGMTFSLIFTTLLSNPFIATETQTLGRLNFNEMSEKEQADWTKDGNSFNRYAISRKISTEIPYLNFSSIVYTNQCIKKYMIKPLTTIANQKMESMDTSTLKPVFKEFEELMVNGYTSDNPLTAPISACINLMPEDSKSVFRITSELLLMGIQAFVTNTEKTTVNSYELINSLENFKAEKNIETKLQWVTPEVLKDFYDWSKQKSEASQIETNPFIKIANNIDNIDNATDDSERRALSKVLRNPVKTYSFMRNIYYVNQTTTKNMETFPFLASLYSSNFFIKGMEFVPTGGLLTQKLGQIENWDNLNPNALLVLGGSKIPAIAKKNYNGFWINKYFAYADLGEND